MDENDFQYQLREGMMTDPRVWLRKFPDLARGIRKPFDLIGSVGGRCIGIEAKFLKVEVRDELVPTQRVCRGEDLRPGQEESLLALQRTQALAFVAAGVYSNTNYLLKRAWLIPIQKFKSKDPKIWWTLAELDTLYSVRLDGVIALEWVPTKGWRLPAKALGLT